MKTVIIGGGISGLASAIALAQKGVEVSVYERAPSPREFGAGLQISPNGCRVLDALGVKLQGEVYPEAASMREGRSGAKIFSIPLGDASVAHWGADFIHIHRYDLLKSLHERAESLGIALIYDKHISSDELISLVEESNSQDGAYIVGADGVHSITRQAIFGDQKAEFSGNVAYRALVPVSALSSPPPREAVIWSGEKKHAITTLICAGEMVNFVGICAEDDWREDGWNHELSPDLLREKFSGWNPVIEGVLEKVESANRWALLYRPNLSSFSKGNVVLVGDAAHPMLPSFAQGAVQALEDAYILAEALVNGSLADYDKLRLRRVARVQAASRRNLAFFHQGGLRRFVLQNGARVFDRFWRAPLYGHLNWLYDYDVIEEARWCF